MTTKNLYRAITMAALLAATPAGMQAQCCTTDECQCCSQCYCKQKKSGTTTADETGTTKIFKTVEQMPTYPGGMGALMQWIQKNLQYPAELQQDSLAGKVIVGFVVETDGSISNVEVMRGVHPALDKEAVRVTSLMPKWNPGRQGGQAVRVSYNIPVSFKGTRY